MAGKIFVNYRRDDVRADARDIAGRLSRTFGKLNVFMDVDNLVAGQRFDQQLETSLAQCDIFIAVIGNQWGDILAQRQAVNEQDFVVDEIAAAIARGIPVIPVLVDGAPLPQAIALPRSIAALPLYQSHEVKHESFGRDVEALFSAIRAIRSQSRTSVQRPTNWGSIAVGAGFMALVIGIGIWAVPTAVNWWEQQEIARKAEGARIAAQTKREAEARKKREIAERQAREDAERRRKAANSGAQEPIAVKVGPHDREVVRHLKPGAGKTVWFKDCTDCPEMVVVPAGHFQMGSPDSEDRRNIVEGPQHSVRISAPFAVGRFEVTFAEWDACVTAGGCMHNPQDEGWGRGRRPVIHVNWEDVQQFARWLSKQTGKRYRLLSEAEWEYVTRAGTTTPFWWGTSTTTDKANYDGNRPYGGGAKGEPRWRTVEVDSFRPNPWGLYQVHGNVEEWVADCWDVSLPKAASAWTSGDCRKRNLRGGSWISNASRLRSASRSWVWAGYRSYSHGFRIARTLNP